MDTVEVDELCKSQTQIEGRWGEGSGVESLSGRGRGDSLWHGAGCVLYGLWLDLSKVCLSERLMITGTLDWVWFIPCKQLSYRGERDSVIKS